MNTRMSIIIGRMKTWAAYSLRTKSENPDPKVARRSAPPMSGDAFAREEPISMARPALWLKSRS